MTVVVGAGPAEDDSAGAGVLGVAAPPSTVTGALPFSETGAVVVAAAPVTSVGGSMEKLSVIE